MSDQPHTDEDLCAVPSQWNEGRSICIQTVTIGEVLAIVEGHLSENDRAKAKRLAAAWNACKGISTNEFERRARLPVLLVRRDCLVTVAGGTAAALRPPKAKRTTERRVGKEGGRTCRDRG